MFAVRHDDERRLMLGSAPHNDLSTSSPLLAAWTLLCGSADALLRVKFFGWPLVLARINTGDPATEDDHRGRLPPLSLDPQAGGPLCLGLPVCQRDCGVRLLFTIGISFDISLMEASECRGLSH